ncbi:hypothetical protein HMPREF1051_2819 [Neisseria sicca VK64]|uniref:Uncharacterized protein n=1 Tax=Neisseria sicca VK64 TaxID=1095748 RepID=I2NVL1_NEISI|nr:hypothetical protein HMPREF1051_2819 [Neisseria sicca VK64]
MKWFGHGYASFRSSESVDKGQHGKQRVFWKRLIALTD